jgi:uncharacterized protein
MPSQLRRSARLVRLGATWTQALERSVDASLQQLGRTLLQAEDKGLPVAASLDAFAAATRREKARLFDAAIRRAPVLMVVPLVVCVLPAFVLLGLGPLHQRAGGRLKGGRQDKHGSCARQCDDECEAVVVRRVVVVPLCSLVLGLGGCYGNAATDESVAASPVGPSPSSSFGTGAVIIDTGEDSVLVDVEVAETQEQRAHGLMNRDSLAPGSGMVFLNLEGNSTNSFYMKDTRIPLSIAFFDVDGRILKILDMRPCRRDPCPTYSPGLPYRGALEVNQGAFDRWGVSDGDTITLVHSSD